MRNPMLRPIPAILNDEVPRAKRAFGLAAPGRIRAAVFPIYKSMDGDLAGSNTKVACRDGCSHCCYYRVEVSAAEALALAERIAAMPADARKKTSERLMQTAQRVAPLSAAQYQVTNVPCAFLENERCSVYEMRPVSCRGHHSLDVAVCIDAFENPDSGSMNPQDMFRMGVYAAYKRVFGIGQKLASRDSQLYEMHGAVAEALNDPAAAKRWRAGEISFPTVRDWRSLEESASE
ncbi:YkgJ family cysteine cluster protein [Ralstonia chuxiongensis]|uniref:YkgJ family cysteine cluster protein n=1 Tax=Ralstonia chuxiongensis TaxID=2957504 RepID=UPI0028F5F8FB|nr:YkgJ family cysteine cluster protein [Ralstonia chuxiongensis]CAJ0784670.1 hypothetical protein R8510_05287 [Ralstonia chuxiongensis]